MDSNIYKHNNKPYMLLSPEKEIPCDGCFFWVNGICDRDDYYCEPGTSMYQI